AGGGGARRALGLVRGGAVGRSCPAATSRERPLRPPERVLRGDAESPRVRAARRRAPRRRADRPAPRRAGRGRVRAVPARAPRSHVDPQEQERFGLDELDQVQLRAADGWLVCTENTAPAPVAVHETPADTLMPGIPEQGPE